MDEEQDQLASDFAINYLAKKGMEKEDILDEEGQLSPEIRDHIIGLMDQNGDRSTFLAEYKANPESKIASVIESEDQVQSAKKGAKLKKISKLQEYKKGSSMKKAKCACGCEMVSKKEEGGKMTSKCGCGCSGISKKDVGGSVQWNSMVGQSNNTARLSKVSIPWNSMVSGPQNTSASWPTLRWNSMVGGPQNITAKPKVSDVASTPQANTANLPMWGNFNPNPTLNTTAPAAKVATPSASIATGKASPGKGNANVSIVDYLNSIGAKSDRASRDSMAASFGIKGSGTGQGNADLLAALKAKAKTRIENAKVIPAAIGGVPRGVAFISSQPGLMASGTNRPIPTVNSPSLVTTNDFNFKGTTRDQYLKKGGEVKKTKEGYLEVLKSGKDTKKLDLKKEKTKK